jgi:hypothetical protein
MRCAEPGYPRNDPGTPSRRDPRDRRGGVFALMGADEEGKVERLKALRRELADRNFM